MRQLLRSLRNRFGHGASAPDASTAPNELAFYETPLGDFYLPLDAPDDVIINCIRHGEIFEPEIVNTARRFIKTGSTVLDVGANFGQMSILFSEMVGDAGMVYAFEADDFVFETLKKNIEANRRRNIMPVFGAVYDRPDEELFFPKQDFKRFAAYGSYGISPGASSGRSVRSLVLDDIDFQGQVSFMKVDVQGSDLFAMRGARVTIEKHKMPILFEFEQQFQPEFGTSFQDYADLVVSIDYKFSEVINGINYLIEPK